jgi:hypothetical protein
MISIGSGLARKWSKACSVRFGTRPLAKRNNEAGEGATVT